MAEHVMSCDGPDDQHLCDEAWPCLPYTLAAAYVAACERGDGWVKIADDLRRERDKARGHLVIAADYQAQTVAERDQARAELATAQGRIDAALAVCEADSRTYNVGKPQVRAALTSDPQ